jgi:hypothetical protein
MISHNGVGIDIHCENSRLLFQPVDKPLTTVVEILATVVVGATQERAAYTACYAVIVGGVV